MKKHVVINYLMLILFGLIFTVACQQKPAPKQVKQSPEDIFKEYFAKEEAKVVSVSDLLPSRGDEEDSEAGRKDTLLKAVQLYNKGQYLESTKALKAYMDNYAEPKADYERANYVYGLCQIENGQFAEAINIFGSLSDSGNREIVEKSRYYRGLCYLVVDAAKAKTIFETIAKDNGSSYQDEAKALLTIL